MTMKILQFLSLLLWIVNFISKVPGQLRFRGELLIEPDYKIHCYWVCTLTTYYILWAKEITWSPECIAYSSSLALVTNRNIK